MIITIDFETVDPHIKKKMGPGWAYALSNPDCGFKVVSCAYKINYGETIFTTDMKEVVREVNKADAIVAHNAPYELGILKLIGASTDNKTVYDTKIMAFLHNNNQRTDLESLSKAYGGVVKETTELAEACWLSGIYHDTSAKNVATKPDNKKLLKRAYEHMDLLMERCPEVVKSYNISDVDATFHIFQQIRSKMEIDLPLLEKFSKLTEVVTAYRARGVRVDVAQGEKVSAEMGAKLEEIKEKLTKLIGDINFNSSVQLGPALEALGILVPRTEKGSHSVKGEWLDEQDHEACKLLSQYKRYEKLNRDFVVKMLDMAKEIGVDEHNCTRIHPEVKIFGAVTGRMASSSPNIQQIPARDAELAPLCRSLFVAEPGEKLFSLDFSNQEGRLQIHYGILINDGSAWELGHEFRKQPDFDMHQQIADMAGISRSEAKTINLGLSYGMGLEKLANSLKIGERHARDLREQYNGKVPFLKALIAKTKAAMELRGYILTLGGRRSYDDGAPHKAFNKLIQGSAADQMYEVMLKCHEAGLKVLFPIHDQILLTGTREDAIMAKEIMETCVKLEVPVVVDVDLEGGYRWSEAGH